MDDLRKAQAALQNAVQRATINRNEPDGAFAQVKSLGGRQRPETEVLQGQGVHFKAPDGSDCLLLAPGGDSGGCVAVAAGDRTALPLDPLMAAGEGGLHYLGTWKVYLAADGTLSLGMRDALDAVALASRVDAAIAALYSFLTTHVHTGVTTGGGVSGPPGPTPPAPTAPAPVGSVILKAV